VTLTMSLKRRATLHPWLLPATRVVSAGGMLLHSDSSHRGTLHLYGFLAHKIFS